MRRSVKRQHPDRDAASDETTASLHRQDESDALARQLSRELNASGRAKRTARRFSPSYADRLPKQQDSSDSRRVPASAGIAPKGKTLVGIEVEIFWVISPEDGEQRPATEAVVVGAIGPRRDRRLVGRWHSAKVLRARGCKVEVKYTADDWVAWVNLYSNNANDYIPPEYWREREPPLEQQPPVGTAQSLRIGGMVPEAELNAFAAQVTLSQSTLKTYSNCIREIICKGSLFGLSNGALLSAKSTDTAVCNSERNRQTSGAHRSSLRKFVAFLSTLSPAEQTSRSCKEVVASSSQVCVEQRKGGFAQLAHSNASEAPVAGACDRGLPLESDPLNDVLRLGKFERRRKGSTVWEPYSKLIRERQRANQGHQGLLHPVAHVQLDSKPASKVWLFAQEGESIRGNLPWKPSVCSAALAKGGDVLATPGAFYVSIGVLSEEQLQQAAVLKEHLPWERHSLTAFARPGQGSADTPAPKRRALLVSCEDKTTRSDSSPTFVYQPHRSGGLASRPNLSMSSKPCHVLGKDGAILNTLMDALCDHNDLLGFSDSGFACVTNRTTAPTTSNNRPVRNIGEGLLYCGGEELKWHHDGNQIADWLTQKDVLSSFILQQTRSRQQRLCRTDTMADSLPNVSVSDLPAALAIKPHDKQWPQVRLHPPAGSKLDLVGTGKIAEHARKPISKTVAGASLLVFVGRRMVDEGLTPLPAMTQACPWDGKPVPQPLNDVPPVYGPIPNVNPGQVFNSIAAIQKLGSHAHVGFHGRAVSCTTAAGAKSSIARGVQSIIHYNYGMHEIDENGDTVRFCVYSSPRMVKSMQGDALAFALSGAAGSPIQYFISGREGSEYAPDQPGQLCYHGIFFVHDWKWIKSRNKMDGAGLRRDHCSNAGLAQLHVEASGRFHMMAKLKRDPPSEKHRAALEEKMVMKIGSGTRAAEQAQAKSIALAKSVRKEQQQRLSQHVVVTQAATKMQPPQSQTDGVPALAKAPSTLKGSFSMPTTHVASNDAVTTPVAAVVPAVSTPPVPVERVTGAGATEKSKEQPHPLQLVSIASSGSTSNSGSEERLSMTPRRWAHDVIRGVINHRKVDGEAMEYKVLLSDATVIWRNEGQLDPELVQEYARRRQERTNRRKKAEMNQANAVSNIPFPGAAESTDGGGDSHGAAAAQL